jgi:hypothetical protein
VSIAFFFIPIRLFTFDVVFKTCTPTTLWMTRGPLSYWAREVLTMTYEHLPDSHASHFTVYCIFLLETLQTSLNGADLYYWFASGFGNMNHITSPYASAFDTPIMGAVVSFMVQMFFVYRIWVLGKRRTWLLCVLIVAVCRSLSGPGSYLTITRRPHLSMQRQRFGGVPM